MCLCSLARSFGIHGILPAAGRCLQLRFDLSALEFAYIRAMFDVAHMVALIPVVYCLANSKYFIASINWVYQAFLDAHRPMWIGVGLIIMGIGTAITTLPRFLIPRFGSHVELS